MNIYEKYLIERTDINKLGVKNMKRGKKVIDKMKKALDELLLIEFHETQDSSYQSISPKLKSNLEKALEEYVADWIYSNLDEYGKK